jgi:hypothetical protein
MQHKWEGEAMQAGGLFTAKGAKDAKDLVFGISTWYLAVTGRSDLSHMQGRVDLCQSEKTDPQIISSSLRPLR